MKKLSDLKPLEFCDIKTITNKGSIRRRFQDIGLIENTRVQCVGESPFGDPKAFLIRGAVFAIRNEDSKKITVTEE